MNRTIESSISVSNADTHPRLELYLLLTHISRSYSNVYIPELRKIHQFTNIYEEKVLFIIDFKAFVNLGVSLLL
jgi:hypothetical protein